MTWKIWSLRNLPKCRRIGHWPGSSESKRSLLNSDGTRKHASDEELLTHSAKVSPQTLMYPQKAIKTNLDPNTPRAPANMRRIFGSRMFPGRSSSFASIAAQNRNSNRRRATGGGPRDLGSSSRNGPRNSAPRNRQPHQGSNRQANDRRRPTPGRPGVAPEAKKAKNNTAQETTARTLNNQNRVASIMSANRHSFADLTNEPYDELVQELSTLPGPTPDPADYLVKNIKNGQKP